MDFTTISVGYKRWAVGAMALLLLVVGSIWTTNQRASAASQTPSVYIVTGENFPDALGVGPASALARGPILMVRKDSVPGATARELTRLAPDQIFLIGGTAVISTNVENQLKNWAPVTRIAGSNRYDTAALVSQAGFPAPLLPGQVDSFYVTKTYVDPFKGDGFALTLNVPVSSPSWLVISGQATFSGTSTFDIIGCGVTLDTKVDEALEGSWRYPTIAGDNPFPTCATQSRVVVAPGSHTVRMNVTGTATGTSTDDRNLVVTVIPLFDTAVTLSTPAVEGPRTLADQ